MLRQIFYSFLLASTMTGALAQHTAATPLPELSNSLYKSRRDSVHITTLIESSKFYESKESTVPYALDTALFYAEAAANLSLETGVGKGLGNSYEQISKLFHRQHDETKGLYYARKAIERFRENKQWVELGYAYYDLSGYYSYNNASELKERIRIVRDSSLPAFQRSGIKLKEADILKELGDLLQLNGGYGEALKVLKTALQLYEQLHYPHLQGIYNLMGAIYSVTGNNEQALKYGLQSLAVSKQVTDTSIDLATIYNRIGATYGRMDRLDLAYEYLKKALDIANKYNDSATIVLESSNISRIEVLLNKPGDALHRLKQIKKNYQINDTYLRLYISTSFLIAYQHLKLYAEAQKYCDTVLNIDAQLDLKDPDKSEAQDPVTDFYLASNQFEPARRRLEMTETFNNTTHNLRSIATNEHLFFKLDSLEGKFKSSLNHYQKYKELEDTLLGMITRNHIEELQIEYQTEAKNRNIDLLENKSRLQVSKLSESNRTRNWFTGIAVLLLIICGLMLNYSVLKQRTNRKLRRQQKEIETKNDALQRLVIEKDWLVKEIHHRVKNNFHIVMGLLGTQSEYLKTEEAITAMKESQNRIYAMSLIHQKLYQSENLTEIDLSEFVYDLVDYLRDSFGIRQSVRFTLNISKIQLGLAYCVPIGLILNEAITNSIKHAFTSNESRTIDISFSRSVQYECLLTISDNGVGLPSNFSSTGAHSMGMKLMIGLTEDLDGKFRIEKTNGTSVRVQFHCDPTPEILNSINQRT